MKCFVTGVAGFIGSHIADRLLLEGHEVIGIDDLSAGYRHNVPYGVMFVEGDVCKIEKYSYLLHGVDVIFHQAASKKNICMRDPARDMEVNGIGTYRLLAKAVNNGVRKFVHASTGSVYGEVNGIITENTPKNPVSYYGISKLAGEQYVRLFNSKINTTILRYFHVYGDRQESTDYFGGVVAIFNRHILAGEPIIIHGDGTQQRVFTHVKDIVEANIRTWINDTNGIYNCASPVQTTISELAEMLMSRYNKRVSVNYTDPLPGDIHDFEVDTSAILKLGVKFRSI